MNNEHYSLDHQAFKVKYINDGKTQSPNFFGPEIMKQKIATEIQAINSQLTHLFSEKLEIGDLFSQSVREAEKTIDTVKALISLKHRDIEAKNQLHASARKYEAQKNQFVMAIEKLQKENQRLISERDGLISKISLVQKSSKEAINKLTIEREEAFKKFKGIQSRQLQYRAQNKKLELTIETMKAKLSKTDKVTFKNSFQTINGFQTYGPTVILTNSQNEFSQIVGKSMEDAYQQLLTENRYYKEYLQNIYKELNSVLQIKRQILKKRRGYDSQFDNSYELNSFKSQILNLPLQYNGQGLKLLNQNVLKFKEAMKLGQALEDRDADQKVNCVANVKNLIKNYKNVVESQDQLLNKVILKAKEFKSNEIGSLQNKYFKGVEDEEIDRAKKFLEEQTHYLESKNKELDMTRKAMQSTLRKVEEERAEFGKRAAQMSDEVQKIKKQVEILPAMIEQELNSL